MELVPKDFENEKIYRLMCNSLKLAFNWPGSRHLRESHKEMFQLSMRSFLNELGPEKKDFESFKEPSTAIDFKETEKCPSCGRFSWGPEENPQEVPRVN